jgi:hypothetical protein
MGNEGHQGSGAIDEALELAAEAGLVVYRLHDRAELTCVRCNDSRDVPMASTRPHIQAKQIERFTQNHTH